MSDFRCQEADFCRAEARRYSCFYQQSKAKDARDRYANYEIRYRYRRIED